MKLQLIARHLRDNVDHVIDEVDSESSIDLLVASMKTEIETNHSERSNWRYYIKPTEETYN
ncbi:MULTISPECIES: hypothetical protein [unclassified Phyllobacterium]|uniref:hypothetical protein n=1 Tax=unclassified Phyllobacterium TaxID=2638441 RepID=UPI003012D1B5